MAPISGHLDGWLLGKLDLSPFPNNQRQNPPGGFRAQLVLLGVFSSVGLFAQGWKPLEFNLVCSRWDGAPRVQFGLFALGMEGPRVQFGLFALGKAAPRAQFGLVALGARV